MGDDSGTSARRLTVATRERRCAAASSKICFAAEVGLSGEIRAVNRIEQRIAEAQKLGFEQVFISKYNQKGLAKKRFNIEVITMSRVEEVYKYLF